MSDEFYTPLFESVVQRYGVIGASVFGRIHRYAGVSGRCTASVQTIANDLRMDVATVKRWAATLTADGLLTKEWERGRTAVYRIGQHSAQSANPTKRTKRQDIAHKALGDSAQSATNRELPDNTTTPAASAAVASARPAKARKPAAPRPPKPHFDAFLALFGVKGKPGRLAGLAGEFDTRCIEHGVDAADIARWKSACQADGSWQYVAPHNAWTRFYAWWGKSRPKSAPNGVAFDERFHYRTERGVVGHKAPTLVHFPDPYNPHNPATWPPEMRAAYAGRIHQTNDGEVFA